MPTTLEFEGSSVALIVRGKTGPKHEPGVMSQHADCVLPDGSPMGFFGGEGVASSGSSGSGSWNSIGMNMEGMVADYAGFQRIRPFYVDAKLAKKYGVISTILVVPAAPSQATAFALYWKGLLASPGSFQILGDNCSTHASEAFVKARIGPGTGRPGRGTAREVARRLDLHALTRRPLVPIHSRG